MPRTANLRDWFMLFALTIFWGTSFLFNELALQAFPPAVLVFSRLALALVALGALLVVSRRRLPRPGRDWIPWIVIAVLGALLPMRLTAWGQQYIGSAETGILMAVSPLLVFTLAHFFLPGERLTAFRLLGFVLGFGGVMLVLGPDALNGLSGNLELLGMLAVLGAALSYSINSVYTRRAAGNQDPLALATGMMLLASLFNIPGALEAREAVVLPPSMLAVVALLILGLVCSALASVMYFELVRGPGPGFTTLVTYLVPVWATLAGALVLHEHLPLHVWGGLALVLSGIAVSELGGAGLRRVRRRRDMGHVSRVGFR
jgi:drug/metabolite transporter (DMT)-like permease